MYKVNTDVDVESSVLSSNLICPQTHSQLVNVACELINVATVYIQH